MRAGLIPLFLLPCCHILFHLIRLKSIINIEICTLTYFTLMYMKERFIITVSKNLIRFENTFLLDYQNNYIKMIERLTLKR